MTDIKEELNLTLNNIHGYYDLKEKDLFDIAIRKNPKRNFLFVSKLIGKHIPIKYEKLEYTGNLLANRFFKETYNSELYMDEECKYMVSCLKGQKDYKKIIPEKREPEKILIIGFAETATGLGFSFFNNFSNAYYVHTTRQKCDEKLLFSFKEEHSHATNHECYFKDLMTLKDVDRIILIDDEFTTGNTCLNLIKELNRTYRINNYSLISILDWRNNCSKEKFEEYSREYNVSIDVISLLSGEITYKTQQISTTDSTNFKTYTDKNYCDFYLFEDPININGNVELTKDVFNQIDTVSNIIAHKLQQDFNIKSPLVLGLEENIYLPGIVAKKMNTKFASMTLSPIYPDSKPDYPIKNAFCFNNDGKKVYLYNINYHDFSDVAIICDKELSITAKQNITGYLHENNFKNIIFCNIRKG